MDSLNCPYVTVLAQGEFRARKEINMNIPKLLALGLSMATPLTVLSSENRPVSKTYSNLPMSFEKNVGQSRAGADFIARGAGYSVSFAPGEAVLALKKQRPSDR